MVTGTVVRFNESSGYGFIAPDGGEDDDVFVHANELNKRGLQVTTGTRVQFEIIDGDRGLKAYDVRLVNEKPRSVTPTPSLASAGAGGDSSTADESSSADADLVEVLSEADFVRSVTELLLECAPQMTGTQITALRTHLLQFARKNGWVD